MNRSLKFLLLGIALLLFGVAYPQVENALFVSFVLRFYLSRYVLYLLGAIFPVAGLIVALVGFFMRGDR